LSSDTDTILKPDPRITRLAPYGYVLKYFSEKAKEIPHASFVAALQLEGIPCDGLSDEPVYKSSLFPVAPADFPALSCGREKPLDLRKMYSCPESGRAAYQAAVWFPHQSFLGSSEEIRTRSRMQSRRSSPISKSCVGSITKPYRIRGSGVRTAKVSPVF
jgi:hypothetical protein